MYPRTHSILKRRLNFYHLVQNKVRSDFRLERQHVAVCHVKICTTTAYTTWDQFLSRHHNRYFSKTSEQFCLETWKVGDKLSWKRGHSQTCAYFHQCALQTWAVHNTSCFEWHVLRCRQTGLDRAGTWPQLVDTHWDTPAGNRHAKPWNCSIIV